MTSGQKVCLYVECKSCDEDIVIEEVPRLPKSDEATIAPIENGPYGAATLGSFCNIATLRLCPGTRTS
jgi:hypothetical protein